jgi:hypothetical protein
MDIQCRENATLRKWMNKRCANETGEESCHLPSSGGVTVACVCVCVCGHVDLEFGRCDWERQTEGNGRFGQPRKDWSRCEGGRQWVLQFEMGQSWAGQYVVGMAVIQPSWQRDTCASPSISQNWGNRPHGTGVDLRVFLAAVVGHGGGAG